MIETTVGAVIRRHFSGPSPDCEERTILSADEWGVLKTTSITWNGWDATAHKVLPRTYWKQPQLEVQPGDVLVTKAGPRHRCAVVVHVDECPPKLIVSGKMIALRPRRDIVLPSILSGLLSLPGPQKYLDTRTTGMAESQVNFTNSVLLAVPLRIPALPEQHRIAEILDAANAAIRQSAAVIAKMRQMRAGLLHDLLTLGLNDQGLLRGPKRPPEQFKESRIGRIPREWTNHSLEELTIKIVDGIHHTPTYTSYGIPFLTVENLTATPGIVFSSARRIAPADHKMFALRANPRPGDVLVTKDGTLGVARVVPADAPEFSLFVSVALLKPNPTKCIPELISTFFDSEAFQSQLGHLSAGTGLKHIHLEHFRAFQLAVPPIAEQHALFRPLRALDARIHDEEVVLEKLAVAKRGLMHDLLTGRVPV